MIKVIFRERNQASSWNKIDYSLLFALFTTFVSAISFVGVYYGLYLFSPMRGGQLLFTAFAALTITLLYCLGRWAFYVSQVQRKCFDVQVEKVKPKKVSKKDEALDFIKQMKSN